MLETSERVHRYPLDLTVPTRIMSPSLQHEASKKGPLKYRLFTVGEMAKRIITMILMMITMIKMIVVVNMILMVVMIIVVVIIIIMTYLVMFVSGDHDGVVSDFFLMVMVIAHDHVGVGDDCEDGVPRDGRR